MNKEEFIKIFDEDDDSSWDGDNALQGCNIMAKYCEEVIQGAGHDVIWCCDIEELIDGGITEEDCIQLRKLNWFIEDSSYMACYV